MKKNYLLAAALAIITMASCSDNEFIGDKSLMENNGSGGAISFNLNVPAITRADNTGSTAAKDLGYYFIVYGEKGETSKDKYSDGNQVFPNYTVKYTTNTAYTTTSNTKDWEYVAVTPISTSNVKMSDGSTTETAPSEQTIKYWDYGAASYTFTAVSANKEDIEAGRVIIQKNTVGSENVYQKGYTITLAKSGTEPSYTYPTVNKLYFADRKVITKTDGSDRTATNAYGGNVTFNFRNLVSQIRAGIYETIPGYDITEIKFFITNNVEAKVSETSAFGAICPNNKTNNYEGTITVTYYSNSEGNENQPKVTQSVLAATDLILGTNLSLLNKTTPTLLGQSATNPTWDTSGGTFTEVFPQINNTTNLQLKCNYTLWNSVTKETITVKGATAEVPAEYLQWKPNYKYTYLFKISDNSNGQTGATGPAGLWPITFDAVEVVAEDGTAEYITTVSNPSITTYAKASAVTTDNEYKTGANIYVVVNNGVSLVTTGDGINAKLYTATIEDGAAQGITEETVKNALEHGTENPTGTWTVTDALGKKLVVTSANSLSAVTEIAAADSPTGVAITVNGAKFTPTTAGTYVFEYTDGSSNKHYKVIKVVAP